MPQQPWDIRNDDSRPADTVANYIIYCEDRIYEPTYFKSYEAANKLRINTIPGQSSGKENLNKVITSCMHDKRMQFTNGSYKTIDGLADNIWCVYDRDVNKGQKPKEKTKEDVYFTTSIGNAASCGVRVAWSNDVFELWILLHFQTVPPGTALHRSEVYQHLTAVFLQLEDQPPALKALTTSIGFDYKKNLKKEREFRDYVLPLLKQRTDNAIRNAAALAAAYPDDVPFHDRNPCSMVYELVQELVHLQ